jgi:hypothetical protein
MDGFDIFSGHLDQEPMWLETAQNLDEASQRMKDTGGYQAGPVLFLLLRNPQNR